MGKIAGPVALGATVLSSLMQAQSIKAAGAAAERAGEAERAAAEYEAEQLSIKAGQERAMAQRELALERRDEARIQSNLQAAAAAGGGGATDAGVLDLAGDIAAEGEYRAGVRKYEGEERARGLEGSASLRRFEGAQAAEAGRFEKKASRGAANAALIGGVAQGASLYSKYYGGGKKKK